jgi:hypothetical protein
MLNKDYINVFKRFVNLNKYAKILHILIITLKRNFGFQILTAIKITIDASSFFFNLVF